jgi:phage baseplate assembly protein W
MSDLKGFPYPLATSARGYFFTQTGVEVLKADLLQLLLTNPGERVMMPEYGTPLRRLLFQPADAILVSETRETLIQAINRWEPRIAVTALDVSVDPDSHMLNINIEFRDPGNISLIENLELELPVGGAS